MEEAYARTGAPPRVRRGRRRGGGSRPSRVGWAFVLPTVVILLLLNTFPLLFSIALSLSHVSTDTGLQFSGVSLQNWEFLLHDASFWQSLEFTVVFTAIAIAVEYAIGFGLALLLWHDLPGAGFFRVLFAIPMMLAPVAIGFTWRMLYDQSNGPIDSVLRDLHLSAAPWLSDTHWAVASVVVMDVWEWTPLLFLLLLAGLQGIPQDALEAARLDGADGRQLITSIVFPVLAPISVMAIFLRMIDSFGIFGQIYLLTGGGPGNATTSTTLFAFFQGFQSFNVGYGSSIALALLIFALLVATFYLTVTRRVLRRVEA
ncbi:MAG: sugar ABC transporter permease [Candidatus Dormiibacterota bacterium]